MEENSMLLLNDDNIGSTLVIHTPKSQKNNTDVRRWASVVKAHKNILNSPEVNRFTSGTDEASEKFDCLPDIVSENYENHKGFVSFDKNSFFCQICSLDLDTMLSLTNHMKTRKHEDNVIVFLKDKLPAHLEHMMEFVSFCNSDLCCNLCQVAIDMSLNPHKTILNIIAHNTDRTHGSLRASHDQHSLAHNLLNTLSETHSEIMENLHFVEKKIIPQFKCKLCSEDITYNENFEMLEKSFIYHFKSISHVKNQKAVEVLKLFDEVCLPGKEKFVAMNGNILCTLCNSQVDTDMEKLILHLKGVEHSSHSLAGLKLFSAVDAKTENKGDEGDDTSVKETYTFNKKLEIEKTENEIGESEANVDPDAKINRLMSILPPDLRQLDYFIENDKGSVTCLICNCVVPPCKHNLLIHLEGNNHQRKLESKKVSKLEETKSQRTNRTENREQIRSVKSLLKSLPEKLGNINYIVPNYRGGAKCLVCQRDLPLIPSTIEEHLKSGAHKEMENLWMNKCPGRSCTSSSDKFLNDVLKIPKDLRVYRCKSVNPTSKAASIYRDYSLLLKKNMLIFDNKNVLVINVDGKNCYCKLCKGLIPLSSAIDELEKNLISHIIGKTHMHKRLKNLGKKLEEVKKTPQSSSSGKVVRSLFVLSSGDEKKREDAEKKACKALSSFDNQNTNNFTTSSLKRKSFEAAECFKSSQKNNDLEVFIFGKNDSDEQYNLENLKNKNTASEITKEHTSLPVSRVTTGLSTYEVEVDEVILSRRQKQLDYGKNTEGYARYRKVVLLSKRRPSHPATPPKYLKCSRRTWDGMVKAWRKKLHAWDSVSLEQDIQPLPLRAC